MRTESSRPVVHLIGNAHIDPVWLWRWPEGLAETKATFQAALDRMRETPDYVFTASSAALYAWVEANEPAMFRQIQARVAEGRWAIAGGWWIEPDCNLPAGESFVRQGLYGQRFFRERFGRLCGVGYCVDSFGHAGTLPKILAGCRLGGYAFMRPQAHENSAIPPLAFRWQGDDGTEVTALRIPQSYGAHEPQRLEANIAQNLELLAHSRLGDQVFAFYGVGNHGGGPTRQLLAQIACWQQDPARPLLRHSTVDAVVAAFRSRPLRRWRGEMQHHARGCYAAVSAIKQANRRAEAALVAAEMWGVAAWLDHGRPPATPAMGAAWRDLLFNQFHDVLAGSSLRAAYADAQQQLGGAIHAAETEANAARQAIFWRIDTRGEGAPLIVYNDQPVPFCGVVETEDLGFLVSADGSDEPALCGPAGRPLPCQAITPHTICGRQRLVVRVEVPALGYTLLRQGRAARGGGARQLGAAAVRVRRRPARAPADRGRAPRPAAAGGGGTGGDVLLENEFLRLGFTAAGHLDLYDRTTRRRVFAASGGAVPLVIEDRSDTWSHGVDAYREVLGSFAFVAAEVRESGPVRGRVLARYAWQDSRLALEFLLGAAERHVEVRGLLDWRERWQVLKLAFPVPFRAATWTAEAPFGMAVRPTNGEEEPVQRWADLSDGPRGLAIANDGRYSASAAPGELRVTILRSPPYAHHDPYRPADFEPYEFTEQGVQRFSLALLPHGGDWRQAGIVELARHLNRPPSTLSETYHGGPLPPQAGFVTCRGRGVYIEALKEAEDGQALILRAVEWFGRPCTAQFALPASGQAWRARFRPHQVKTFRLPAPGRGGRVAEVDLLEE